LQRSRILYVQYTNPAGYPPLEHSSRLLADAGWQVLFLGAGSFGAATLRFPPHANIQEEQSGFCPAGWRQKLHYLRFCFWVVGKILTWRPDWVYFSLSVDAPLAWLVSSLLRVRVIYHEHDSPRGQPSNVFEKSRQWLFRNAPCVWPSQRRAEIVAPECPRRFIVWNCPRLDEVPGERTASSEPLQVFYHGSINAARLPLAVIQSLALLPASVRLTVVGYETVGAANHGQRLREEAARLGVTDRLVFPGRLSRYESMRICSGMDVGITLMPLQTTDINEDNMVGPSNKAFDYLACGLALLMADRSDWRETFGGYGMTCDPQDPQSIAAALRWFLDHPAETRAMGELGRRRILNDWNYEAQFQPVMDDFLNIDIQDAQDKHL
jgi:glycosyltransferase involved in cell wall biosynthesis